LYVSLTLLYFGFSPGSIRGMGYLSENMKACEQIVKVVSGGPGAPPSLWKVAWPRHGFVGLVFEMPFFLVGHWVGAGSPAPESMLLSFEIAAMSAAICALLYLWIVRLTGSMPWGLVLSLGAAFGTLIWPYAYIGLEPAQSFFLLLAGYVALATPEGSISYRRTAALALALAVAVSVKSNGIFLIPVAGYLLIVYLQRAAAGDINHRRRLVRFHGIPAAVAILGLFMANRLAITAFWVRFSGRGLGYLHVVVRDWMAVPLNFFSFFGSINKSLLIFAPVTAVALWLVPRAWRTNRAVTAFALLTLFGMAGGMSLTYFWADDTWGPRYLHVAVAPLILVVAAAVGERRIRIRRDAPLIAALVIGALVSGLGSFFYYGALPHAAWLANQSTVENLQYDPVWNHIRFNARLVDVWLKRPILGFPADPMWTPQHIWLFRRAPSGVSPWKPVNLAPLARPQPALVRYWGRSSQPFGAWWFVFPLFLTVGVLLMAILVFKARVIRTRINT